MRAHPAPGTCTLHPARHPAPGTPHPAPDLACACATARQAARSLTQLYDGWLRESGVEAPQFALLVTLEKDGASSQAGIGRRHALDKTTVSRNLKLLERRGWIRSSEGRDRRERCFSLTPTGRKRLAAAKPKWAKAQAMLRAQMDAKTWTAMFSAFKVATDAAGRAGRNPAL